MQTENNLHNLPWHQESFVIATLQLLKLNVQGQNIIDDPTEEVIRKMNQRLRQEKKAIVRHRKLMKNAESAVDRIAVCLPVLENYAKLQDQMSNKKYYQALKTLEELEHNHLVIDEKYRFTQVLAKSMTPVRLEIKEKAYSEFKDFLENIKKVAGRIGKHAIKYTAEQHSFGVTDAEQTRKIQEEARKNASNVEIEVSADGSIVKKNVSPKQYPQAQVEDDEQMSAQDLIDFTPVHRYCQIFNVLGAKDEFEQYYRQQRREQCDLVIEPSHKMNNSKHYVKYLEKIVGFFVVEEQILMTQSNLSTNSDKDKLWDNALQKIRQHLDARFMMLRMKKVILLFILTMKSYGYAVAPLYELLQNFRDQYNEILVKEYCAQFERDLDKDNYTPITVHSEEEFRAVMKQFPFYKRSMEQEPFPRKFPFSQFVISAYTQAKQYLVRCLKFMDNLQLNTSAVDDTVRRCANVLLGRWAGILKTFVHKRLSMIQLVQITINHCYLEKMCDSLKTFITRKTSGGEAIGMTSHQVVLSEKVFRDVRSEVEQQIGECMRNKVDEIIELANYDWELPAASGQASYFITDLIKFLLTTFQSFTNLPSGLAKRVCTQTCKHISQSLSDLLLSPETKCISTGALDQFSLDVMQQLLDLVISSDWKTFNAEYGKDHAKYHRVKALTAIVVLEKMLEYERKST
uniref:Exocyst complex component n=1 Tax=Caenorhabditis tropicalis TaxID=1561998 RepID=A0A1I7TR37_9PELO